MNGPGVTGARSAPQSNVNVEMGRAKKDLSEGIMMTMACAGVLMIIIALPTHGAPAHMGIPGKVFFGTALGAMTLGGAYITGETALKILQIRKDQKVLAKGAKPDPRGGL